MGQGKQKVPDLRRKMKASTREEIKKRKEELQHAPVFCAHLVFLVCSILNLENMQDSTSNKNKCNDDFRPHDEKGHQGRTAWCQGLRYGKSNLPGEGKGEGREG